MAATRFFLANSLDGKVWKLVHKAGQYWPGVGVSHPQPAGMTDLAWEHIGKAVEWACNETLRPMTVDLEVDGHWRIAWL